MENFTSEISVRDVHDPVEQRFCSFTAQHLFKNCLASSTFINL